MILCACTTGRGSQLQGDQEIFQQAKSLPAALLGRQLVLLGRLLATVGEPNQLQILDVLTAAAAGQAVKKGMKESPPRRQAVITSACCAALSGLDSLAQRYRGKSLLKPPYTSHASCLSYAAIH